mmetsp:Transcript_38478/g.101495  ORF Transcript_38478/g.101495 Transcript_38478/m.101495 type:complete len:270 (-) Transcript_38478:221-1030(-)
MLRAPSRAHSLCACRPAPSQLAFARAVVALAVPSTSVWTHLKMALCAMPSWRAMARAVAALPAMLTAAVLAVSLLARYARPTLVALAGVRLVANAVARTVRWAYAHGTFCPTPSGRTLAFAVHAPSTVRTLIWACQERACIARVARKAMAGTVVAVAAMRATARASLQRTVEAREAFVTLARWLPAGLHSERLIARRLADPIARAIVRADAKAAVSTAIARVAEASGITGLLHALAMAGAAVGASLEGAIGAGKTLSAPAYPVEACART